MPLPHYAVKINAGYSTNGNPRRGWWVYTADGVLVTFVEEGQLGDTTLRQRFPHTIELTTLRVRASDYRDGLKRAKDDA